jgi:nicotinate phosphoribosyltransferase
VQNVNQDNVSLFTDIYELRMMQAYYLEGMHDTAIFDLYVRALPPNRNFLLACGLEDVLQYLEGLSFSQNALDHLRSLGEFSPEFLAYLSKFRFTGTVRAMPEGTVAFANELLLEVSAPLPEAQLIETYLLNQINFQTAVASKGARAVHAAAGRTVVDFGSRRTHGTDAALKAARVLYIAGFASTSNVLAGQLYGIPQVGTMAHSYIEAHDDELAAFRAFAQHYPQTVLLVDTYDTVQGVRNVIELASELGGDFRVLGVRLDSGDLAGLALAARRLLDDAGLDHVGIVVSGGIDEYTIADLVAAEAPVTLFATGTNVGVSVDSPKLDSAYKLVSYAGRGRLKLSPGKVTLPGAKQVYRRYSSGTASEDIIATQDETIDGEPLLVEVMRDGRRLPESLVPLEAIRERVQLSLAKLPERLRSLEQATPLYPVNISPKLQSELVRLQEEARLKHGLPIGEEQRT